MKKSLLIATMLSLALTAPLFAEEEAKPKGPGPNFEQRKTEILKMLDHRLAAIQEAKACVQAATNHEELKGCKKKHREEMKKMRDEMKKGGPGGQ